MHHSVTGGRRQKSCISEAARCAREGVDDFPKY